MSVRKSYSNHNSAAGNRRHDGNGITVLKHGGFFLEVAHVFVIDVDVHERPQLAVVSIKVALQIGMPRDQASEGFAHGFCRDVDRRLFPRILTKWRRNLDLGHVKKMLWHWRKMQVQTAPAQPKERILKKKGGDARLLPEEKCQGTNVAPPFCRSDQQAVVRACPNWPAKWNGSPGR